MKKHPHENMEGELPNSCEMKEESTTKSEDSCIKEGDKQVSKENKGANSSDKQGINELRLKLEQKTKEADEYLNLLQRTRAEFENYKKRTAKEKESLYNNSVIDVMINILPIVDNMEKAINACNFEENANVLDGVEMTLRQFKEVLKNFGICQIEAIGQKFNPELHEAVMHIQDESLGENEVIEEFRKGYLCGEKVLRHSMVKVAN